MLEPLGALLQSIAKDDNATNQGAEPTGAAPIGASPTHPSGLPHEEDNADDNFQMAQEEEDPEGDKEAARPRDPNLETPNKGSNKRTDTKRTPPGKALLGQFDQAADTAPQGEGEPS